MKRLLVYKTVPSGAPPPDAEQISFDELAQWVGQGTIARKLFAYDEVILSTPRLCGLRKPLAAAVLSRLLCRGRAEIADEYGTRVRIDSRHLFSRVARAGSDLLSRSSVLRDADRMVSDLERGLHSMHGIPLRPSSVPIYLRSDLWFGIHSGGSVGHISGVLNHLGLYCRKPIFLTTDRVPLVRSDIETKVILPEDRYWDFRELPLLAFNRRFERAVREHLAGREIGFIYQRYSLDNYTGAKLARERTVPFILEYNGSEVWINRHWGKPLHYEDLAERIERLNLRAADVIVVVSRASKEELIGRGVDPGKVLVNPNGVDPERYSPEIDGSLVRELHGLGRRTVIGFIGTFGRWHGAEVLADAYGRLLAGKPELRETTALLLIGDGVMMGEVKRQIDCHGVARQCVLTGLVPQEQGPAHLAACDILVAPHVPNPDGTPFFGSPTKLFEYMAMGKGIVAADLDQIGEVLSHQRTAWLTRPGDADSLAAGLRTLVQDKDLRERLGTAARADVVVRFTWREHTRKIIEALEAVCG